MNTLINNRKRIICYEEEGIKIIDDITSRSAPLRLSKDV